MSVVIIVTGGGGKRASVAEGVTHVQLVFTTTDLSYPDINSVPITHSFTSSNSAVATVNSSGAVTRIAPGRVIMTCTASRAGFTHTEAIELVFPGDSDDFLTDLTAT